MPAPSPGGFVTLPKGLRVRLGLPASGEPLPGVVRAIGTDRLTLGLLDLPPGTEALKGARATIEARIHGRMYELEAAILDFETAPPALVVSLPSEARQSQRRNFYRLNVSVPVRASWREPGGEAEDEAQVHQLSGALLLDLSGGGAQLRTREPVPINAILNLEFTLERGEATLQVAGRALTCRAEERTHAYRINTEFVGIARRTQEAIVRFIYQQQTRLSRRRSA